MAGLHNVSHTPLSNRYNDEDASRSRLPSGGCNYTNLSLGVNAAKCGCKRFWDKSLGGSSINGEKTGFCMCEHHACYHDEAPPRERDSIAIGNSTPRQMPRTLENQDQNFDTNLQMGGPSQEAAVPDLMQWSRYLNGSSQGLPPIPSQCLLPSDNGSVTSASQSAYYRPFGGRGLDTLSHIVRTEDAPTARLSSSNSRMQIYEDRHGVQHLQSLTDIATPSLHASQDPDVDLVDNAASAANRLETIEEVQDSQMPVPLRPVSSQNSQTPTCPGMVEQPAKDHDKQLVLHVQHLREPNDLPERMENHEQRLEQLENVSFTHPGIEQLQESHEHMEIRVGELEHRINDIETAQAAQDASSVGTRPSVGGSFDSRISNTSVSVPHIGLSRVEMLEAQVAELQAIAPPTYSRPWEIEVVFLPFGSRLLGIWSSQDSMSQASRLGSTGPDEWTQTQQSLALAQARLTTYDRTSAWERSAMDLAQEDSLWLMAKACRAGGKVDRRLRSRGLVRKIQICGPDARDVQSAMLSAFGELPGILAEDPYSSQDENMGEIPKALKSYIGLQAPWIPVRKLHKDSCLRFLNPAEMLTPALWTVSFLSSSVAMRHSSTRRLYVTQRDGYIQQHSDSLADWTWQKLRQLPRVYPESSSINHTPEADAQEECWTFDPRLDPPPTPQTSFHSSFHSQISQLSIDSLPGSPELLDDVSFDAEPVSPSDHFSSAPASPTVSTPRTSLPSAIPLSPLKQRNPFRPIHRRTISMSSIVPTKGETSSQGATQSSKRRVPSFTRETQSSPAIQSNTIGNTNTSTSQPLRSLEISTKRRRISRSPSRPRNTPRWSMGSPSPLPVYEGDKERGTTPFAYATPHSNVTYAPRSGGVDVYEDEDDDADYFDGGDHAEDGESSTDEDEDLEEEGYEQNALSDYELECKEQDIASDDDEWQGVQDDVAAGVYDSRYAGLVNQSFSNEHEHERQVEEEFGEDAASEASESPSEYPSTQQPQMEERYSLPKDTLEVGAAVVVKRAGLFERRQKKEMGFTIHIDEEAGDT